MSTIIRISKNALIYTFSNFFLKGINFFLLPVYTLILTPNDFGILGTVQATIAFLALFVTLGLNGAANRFYFIFKNEPETLKDLWGTIYTTVAIFCLLLLLSSFTILKPLLQWTLNDISFFPYMAIGIVDVCAFALPAIYLVTLRTREKAFNFSMVNLFLGSCGIGLTLLFLFSFKMSAEGPLLGHALAKSFFLIFFLIYARNEFHWGINLRIFKRVILYSLPLIPHALAGWSSTLLSRILLNKMTNTYQVGLYHFGFALSQPLLILISAFFAAINPWLTDMYINSPKRYREVVPKMTNFAIPLAVLFCFFYLIGIRWFSLNFIPESYHSSLKIISILIMGNIFHLLYMCFSLPLWGQEKGTRYIPFITLGGATIQVIFLLLLIPPFGFIGAAISWLISRSAIAFLAFFISQSKFKMQWNYWMFVPIFLLLLFVLIEFFMPDLKIIFTIFTGIALIILTTLSGSHFYKDFIRK